MIITGKKFSKPELSRVINGDTVLPEAETAPEKRRLDIVLTEKYPEYNRSILQSFIKRGFVKVNQKTAKRPNEQVGAEDIITLEVPERIQTLPELPIIYEDDHVLVVNKPSGMLSVAKGGYCPEPSLEDYGMIVHRLDRDTSGVMILAKDRATQKMLRRQFQERRTHKTYLAVIAGSPRMPEAIIDLPIARNLKHPTTFQVDQNGRPAQTRYRILQTQNHKSLIELKPISGRTHQLRIHLKYIGTPILGDPVYGNAESAPRLMLHAKELEITIPGSDGNIRKTFVAPLPEIFDEIMNQAKI